MNDEKINIKIPISKSYFNTFVNSFLNIHFLNDTSFTLESLKNLLFPPEHNDKEFNQLVDFIKIAFDDLIKHNKSELALKTDLEKFVKYLNLFSMFSKMIFFPVSLML
jgi:hypothetical protein